MTCAVYTGLLRNKFHSSNRHDIRNLLRNLLATEKQREKALDVDDLICHNFPNFGPEPFCIGQIFLQPQKIAELVNWCKSFSPSWYFDHSHWSITCKYHLCLIFLLLLRRCCLLLLPEQGNTHAKVVCCANNFDGLARVI